MTPTEILRSMMRTCRNCRWWQEHVPESDGFCRTDPNMGEWSEIPVRQTLQFMWAKHDEVRTRPDFGCNQFEGKE